MYPNLQNDLMSLTAGLNYSHVNHTILWIQFPHVVPASALNLSGRRVVSGATENIQIKEELINSSFMETKLRF